MSALPRPELRYTYADYRTWPDEVRGELIDGVFYDMSPAPGLRHQSVAGAIFSQWRQALRGKTCRPYIAPADVLLPRAGQPDDQTGDVVQPDVFIVCDKNKLDGRFVRGAPDVVVEVLSTRTARKDQTSKLALYESSGVREYWLLHPEDRVLTIYTQDSEAHYGRPRVLAAEGSVELLTMPELSVDFEDVFAE
jgi:Uma2 family endonuclease